MRTKGLLRVRSSRFLRAILNILKEEGYISDYRCDPESPFSEVEIELKYYKSRPALKSAKRISKPGCRVYTSKNVPAVDNGLGTIIVSTSQGVLTDSEARRRGIGGEVLCSLS
jgi:small subunit ribosomal protein S8